MSEKMFTSKTAEVKSLIAAFMGQVQEEAERKDIVEYVQTHIENGVTVSYRITCNNGNQRPLINP